MNDGFGDQSRGPMMSYKQWIVSQPDDLDPDQAKEHFSRYKKRYIQGAAKSFWEDHKDEEWFASKYNPVEVAKRKQNRHDQARLNYIDFKAAFDQNNIPTVDDDKDLFPENRGKFLTDEAETGHVDIETSTKIKSGDDNDTDMADANNNNNNNEVDFDKALSEASSSRANGGGASQNKFVDNALFIQTIPLTCKRQDLVQLFEPLEGFQKLQLSDPIRNMPNNRYGWVYFSSQEQCESVTAKLNGTKLPGFFLNLLPKRLARRREKRAPAVTLDEDRIKHDLRQAEMLCLALDAERGIEQNFLFRSDGGDADDGAAESALSGLGCELKQLNVVLYYLRLVHCFNYYSAQEFFDEEQFHARIGENHVRARAQPGVVQEKRPTHWEREIDAAIEQRIANPETELDRDFEQHAKSKFGTDNTVQVDKSKFRCKVCGKLFKGANYVLKHIMHKHPEQIVEYIALERERQFIANYEHNKEHLTEHHFQSAHMRAQHTGHHQGGGRGRFGSPQFQPAGPMPNWGGPQSQPGFSQRRPPNNRARTRSPPRYRGGASGSGRSPPRDTGRRQYNEGDAFAPSPNQPNNNNNNQHQQQSRTPHFSPPGGRGGGGGGRRTGPGGRRQRQYNDLDAIFTAPQEDTDVDYGFDDLTDTPAITFKL